MNSSEAMLFYGIFGAAFVLAGLQAIFAGEIRIPRRQMWEDAHTLEGQAASWLGLVFVLWGLLLCINGVQLYKETHPTLFESIMQRLSWSEDTGILMLLVINFSLFAMPYFLWLFTSRGE